MINDIRYALRLLTKNPAFAGVVVLTLALGIGANAAIFSLLDQVLLQSLPVANPDQLVVLSVYDSKAPEMDSSFSYLMYQDLRDRNSAFSGVIARGGTQMNVSYGDQTERVSGELVSGNFYEVLGVRPWVGRLFTQDDDRTPGAHPVTVLSYRFWESRFNKDPNLIGKTILINEHPMTVLGVTPPTFYGVDLTNNPDVRVPLMMTPVFNPLPPTRMQSRRHQWLSVMARRKADVSPEQAQASLSVTYQQIRQSEAEQLTANGTKFNREKFMAQRIAAIPGDQGFRHLQVELRTSLLLLFGATCAVLLILCANLANLMMARATVRAQEITVRLALGAGRLRLLRQWLTEGVVLSTIGGVVGIFIALWIKAGLIAFIAPDYRQNLNASFDWRLYAFILGVSLLLGIAFSLAPAIQAGKTDVNNVLKSGGKGSINPGSRLRRVLVVAEVALSLMLFIGAGLLMKSFWILTRVNPGFQSDHLLTLRVSLPEQKYSDDAQVIEFYKNIPVRFSALPGVQAVSAVNRLPISGGDPHGDLTIEGRTFAAGDAPGVSFRRILPNYFRAMGIPLLQGREFDDRDTGGRPDVVIVNQKMAQRYWPDGDAVGKRIKIGPAETEPWVTIVGVVGNVNHTGLDAEPDFATYEPHAKRPWSEMTVLVRTSGDPLSLAAPVQRELKSAESEILIEDVGTMNRRLELSVTPQRMNLVLLGTFAFIALVLATAGIYAVMAHSVAQRTQEIGVRMALGAQLRDVLTMVLRSGITLTLLGISIGLIGAFGLTRLMSKLLFGVTPTDAVTFASVAAILFVVALLACYIPARRATKVDPMVALRYE